MTTNNKRSFLRILGYVAFFLACFVISLVITFPYDRLTGYAEQRLQPALGLEVSIEKLRPTLLGGVRVEGVTLGPGLKLQPGDSTSPWVRIDRATIGVSWLGLLLGGTDVTFDAEVAGGQAEGSYEQDEEHLALKLSFNGLQASQLPILEEKVGLPVAGTLMGSVDVDIPVGQVDESRGSLQLGLQGGVIGNGKAKLSLSKLMGYGRGSYGGGSSEDEGTLIQPIKLGPVNLQSKLVKGVADIPQVEASSPDADLTFEGRIKLAEPLAQSRVDTYLTVKLTESYAEQDAQTSALVSLIDTVGARAKRPDGSLGFRISGTFGTGLSLQPSRNFSVPGRRERGPRTTGRRRPPPRRRIPRPPRSRNTGNDDQGDEDGPSARPSMPPRPTIAPSPTARPNVYPSGMPRPAPSPTSGDTEGQPDNNTQYPPTEDYQTNYPPTQPEYPPTQEPNDEGGEEEEE